jgi:hypothetical protein
MNPVTFEPALLEKLLASMQSVDVCDQSGKIVGRFTPKIDPNDYEAAGPEISDEELTRRINSNEPRIPGAEVLSRLVNL